MRAVPSARSIYRPSQKMDSATLLNRALLMPDRSSRPRLLLLLLLLLVPDVHVRARADVHRHTCRARVTSGVRRRRELPRTGDDPRVLGPAPLARVDDEPALLQGDAGETAGKHPHLLAVVHGERPQVDVTSSHAFVHPGRRGRERNEPLGDPGAGRALDPGADVVELVVGGERTEHEALAARAVHQLEHQLAAIGE